MCFNDWRIGRLIRSVYHYGEDFLLASLTLNQNSQRVGYTISCAETNAAASGVILLQDPSSGKTFMVVALNCNPVHITLATHGDLPTRAVKFQPSGGTGPIYSVIEYIAPEEYLTAALQQFHHEYPGIG